MTEDTQEATTHSCACTPGEGKTCGCKSNSATVEEAEVMCVCDHNPQGACHCGPFTAKCDQKHHLAAKA